MRLILAAAWQRPPPAAGKSTRLPSGLRVRYVSQDDVRFLWKEVHEDRVQLQHGVELRPGATVLDVGANIGLFSLLAAERVGPEGLVIACEPLPATFQALEANVESHGQWCAERGIAPGRVVPLNIGIGDGSRPSATFTLYERAAGWGTMYPSEEEVIQDMGKFLDNALAPSASGSSSAPSALSGPMQALGAALKRGPRQVYEVVWRVAVQRMLGARTLHECPLRSVSALIDDYALTKVDLLKVDVERAELEVLQGVAPRHWPLVQQAVIEVHGVHLDAVLGLLRQQGGFDRVVVEQEADLRGTSLHMVYCRRGDCP